MTYGHWLYQARAHLREAATNLARGTAPADMAAVLAVDGARRDVYRAIARHTELLLGELPGSDPRRSAVAGPAPAAFLVSVRDASTYADPLPPASPTSGAGLALRQATGDLAVAGDILAGHVEPGHRPRTAEGAAIRAGGGVAAGLGEIAQMCCDAIAVDLLLPDWLTATEPHLRGTVRPLLRAAKRTAAGRLPRLAHRLITAAIGHTPLLPLLDSAPATGRPATAVATAQDAAMSLRAARTWLWQNPNQIQAVHLRLGTQLGLAGTLVATDPSDTDPVDSTLAAVMWRRAVAAASQLRGSPPEAEARYTADTLNEVLCWTRNLANQESLPPPGVERVTEQLPALAEVLLNGVPRAVSQGDLFVQRHELVRPAKSLVAYAVPVWRKARMDDNSVTGIRAWLREAVLASTDEPTHDRSSPARVAFTRQPRPGTTQVRIFPATATSTPSVAMPHRRR